MAADIGQIENENEKEELVDGIVIKPIGIPIKEVRVMARIEEI